MTEPQFIAAVDNLVEQWQPISDSEAGPDRETLKAIYNDVREQAVKDCADWVEQRNKALELIHSHYVKGGKK